MGTQKPRESSLECCARFGLAKIFLLCLCFRSIAPPYLCIFVVHSVYLLPECVENLMEIADLLRSVLALNPIQSSLGRILFGRDKVGDKRRQKQYVIAELTAELALLNLGTVSKKTIWLPKAVSEIQG